jgi:hypothetical protein
MSKRLLLILVSAFVVAPVMMAQTVTKTVAARRNTDGAAKGVSDAKPRATSSNAPVTRPAGAFGQVPLSFEENHGQTDPGVKYLARGNGYTLFLTPKKAVLSLRYLSASTEQEPSASRQSDSSSQTDAVQWSQADLQLSFAGANPAPPVLGVNKQQGISNYFIGNDSAQWHTQIPNYGRVVYQGVYPGVDVAYYGNEGQLETDFILAPQAEANKIRLSVDGAASLRVNESGDLLLQIDGGEVRLKKPFAYQIVNGARREISVGYQLLAKNETGFSLGTYDHSQKLIIDPALIFSTYLGGSGQDSALAVVTDGNGDTFVTGQTTSTNFPTAHPSQAKFGFDGVQNAFVTEYAPDGQSFIFSTYLGGDGIDSAKAITINSIGQVYLAGQTTSSNFPLRDPLAGQSTFPGGTAAFVSKLAANGTALFFSTYLGGGVLDSAAGIALDSANNIYVAGGSSSSSFPVVNAFRPTLQGTQNGFIAKLASTNSGSSILYSSFIGGTSSDAATAIAVDPKTGDAFLAGLTTSNNFPTVAPFQPNLGTNAGQNAWVSEIKQTKNVPTVSFATYLGGSVFDQANGIAIDANEDVYVTGFTQSPDFPLQNALQAFGGQQDAFVTKFAPGGGSLLFSTYFGGSGFTFANAVALDSSKNVYFTGSTNSVDYPTLNPLVATLGDSLGNTVITELSSDGSAILFSSYLGGSSSASSAVHPADSGNAIAVDASGNIYVAGAAGTFDFPTLNPLQQFMESQSLNAFVARIGTGSATMLSPVALNLGSSVVGASAPTQRMSFEQASAPRASISSVVLSGANPGDFLEFDTCGSALPLSVVCEITITFTPQAAGGRSAVGTITTSVGNFVFDLSGTGITAIPPAPPGTLSIPTTPLTFGPVEISLSSSPQFIIATNTGTTPVALNLPTTSGTNSSDFSASLGNCPTVNAIPGGATCQISVTFAPQPGTAGTRSATLNISGNFTTSPVAIALSGTAVARIGSLAPNPIQFPNTVVNAVSSALTATLTNTAGAGGPNLTGITNSISGPFQIAASQCTQLGQLTPGQSCTISLTFNPTVAGISETGTLTVNDSDPATQSVTLVGTALDTNATLQVPIPTHFSFGRTTVGTTAAAQGVDLVNIGNANLTFTLPSGGANPGDFSATPNASATCNVATAIVISPGGDCFVTLNFTPTAPGARFATFTVQSTAVNTPVTLNLSGTGDAPTTVQFTPNPLTFPATAINSQSTDLSAILINTGSTEDVLGSASLGGANPGDFQIDFSFSGPSSSNCLKISTLNAQVTCVIPVKFTPTALGARTATLSIADSATGNPHSIALQGQGATPPAVQFNPTSLTFTSQVENTTSAAQQFNIQNGGGTPLTFTSFTPSANYALVAPTGSTPACAVGGAGVAPNASCALAVTFTPTSPGTISGSIVIADNAANNPQSFLLSGTGVAPVLQVSLSTNSLAFAAQNANTTSAAQQVTVTNTGNANITFSAFTPSGNFAVTTAASTNPACSTTVALTPNSSCDISVTFTPTTIGTLNGSLNIVDNATGSPQSVALTGTGVGIAFNTPPGGSATATVDPGGTAVFPLVLSSTGLTGTATLTCSAQSGITCTVVPGTVPITPNGITHTAIVVNSFCSRLSPPVSAPRNIPGSPWLIAIVGLALLASMALTKKRSLRLAIPLAMLLLIQVFASSCGSPPEGPAGATKPGTYPLVITARVGQATATITLTLIVK